LSGGVLVVAALVVAVGDWVAVARGRRSAEYLLKPLTLVGLIAAAIAFRGGEPSARWILVLGALGLSLAGDVFLMLPRDLFLAGLGAFLLAHVAYVFAFNTSPPPMPLTAIAGAGVTVAAAAYYLRLRPGMGSSMALPAAVYAVAIGAMLTSAIVTAGRADWSVTQSSLAIGAAGLFVLSDGLIGWNRFVRPVSRVAIMVTYHLAQAALVLALLA
jgi:uncharacterized membrane protein YhhN